MGLMKRLLDHLDFGAALQASELPQPDSNPGYRPEPLIMQLLLSVWWGVVVGHAEVTRHDRVLQRLLGFQCMAQFQAVMRLFRTKDLSTHTPPLMLDADVRAFYRRFGFECGAVRAATASSAEGCCVLWGLYDEGGAFVSREYGISF